MMNEKKIALMFSLAEEQQKTVQELIKSAEKNKIITDHHALDAAKIAIKALGDTALSEVKDKFNNYESNLESLLSKANQANQALDIATKKFSYKLIYGFAIFAFSCTLSLLGVSFWLSKTIQEQRNTISILESKGGDFQFSKCDGKICIKVEDTPKFEDGYRIISRN